MRATDTGGGDGAVNELERSVISLTVPAKPEYLIVCRLALNGLAEATPVGDETLSDLKLAVTEACANSISHAYEGDAGAITLTLALRDGMVQVEVVDTGGGIDETVEPPELGDVDDFREGGMGIGLISALVEELEIGPGANGTGTRVVFSKRLP